MMKIRFLAFMACGILALGAFLHAEATGEEAGSEPGIMDVFKQFGQRVMEDSVEELAGTFDGELKNVSVVEQRGNTVVLDVTYDNVKRRHGVRIEAEVFSGGVPLDGFSCSYAPISRKRGKMRLRIMQTSEQDEGWGLPAGEVASDQIVLFLVRENDSEERFAEYVYELSKTWTGSDELHDADVGEQQPVLEEGEAIELAEDESLEEVNTAGTALENAREQVTLERTDQRRQSQGGKGEIAETSTAPGLTGATRGTQQKPQSVSSQKTQQATQLTLKYGINYPGKDYNNGMELDDDCGPECCLDECAKDSKCKAYSYTKPGVQGDKARCWLKNSVPNSRKDSNNVSGSRETIRVPKVPLGATKLTMEYDTDYPGMDYDSLEMAEDCGPECCRDECAIDPKCKAYSYVKPGVRGKKARCWLKNGVPKPRSISNNISGRILERSSVVRQDYRKMYK